MRFLVLGSGAMGRAVAFDLARSDGVDEVVLSDSDEGQLENAAKLVGSPKLSTLALDVTDPGAVVETMDAIDVAISCVPYRFNHELTIAAIEACGGLCDLGGNNEVVRKQLCLDAKARRAGVRTGVRFASAVLRGAAH